MTLHGMNDKFQKTNLLLGQRLMEEIERNMDNIENCEKNAKAYIDSVKVCYFRNFYFFFYNFLMMLAAEQLIYNLNF